MILVHSSFALVLYNLWLAIYMNKIDDIGKRSTGLSILFFLFLLFDGSAIGFIKQVTGGPCYQLRCSLSRPILRWSAD